MFLQPQTWHAYDTCFLPAVRTMMLHCSASAQLHHALGPDAPRPDLEAPLPVVPPMDIAALNAHAAAILQRALTLREAMRTAWTQRHADTIKYARQMVIRQSFATDTVYFFKHDLPLERAHPCYALLSNFKSIMYQSDGLQNYWSRFAALQRIRSWRTGSRRDLYDFLHSPVTCFYRQTTHVIFLMRATGASPSLGNRRG